MRRCNYEWRKYAGRRGLHVHDRELCSDRYPDRSVLFLLIRPQRKRDKAEREMRNSIQVTRYLRVIGGFIGRVVSIKDDVLVIESSSDRTKLKLYRWAIRGKEAPATESVEAPKEAKETKKDDK